MNEQQQQAVDSASPRLLIIAGAGSGKTKVLTERVVRLLRDGVASHRILAVTFTRKAGQEMRDRIQSALWDAGLDRAMPEISTFHAWAARLCRRHAPAIGRTPLFTIYDERDSEDVLRAAARDAGIANWESAKLDKLRSDAAVLHRYEERKRGANAVDFDDLERSALRLLVENDEARAEWTTRYDHVLVDEYQDTNLAQHTIVGALYPPNLCVVGDPRQSIYRFRGARVEQIEQMAREADWQVITLTANYRSTPEIVAYANRAVDGDYLPMTAARPSGEAVETVVLDDEPVGLAERIEAHIKAGVPPGSIAVLARTWSVVGAVHAELQRCGIPSTHCGPTDDPWSTSDGRQLARSYLLARNPEDNELASLLADWGAEGGTRLHSDLRRLRAAALVARRTLLDLLGEQVDSWGPFAAAIRGGVYDCAAVAECVLDSLSVRERLVRDELQHRLASLEACIEQSRGMSLDDFADWWLERSAQDRLKAESEADTVQCMTVHASKGLEWPVVILAGARDGAFPANRGEDDDAESLRLYYVAATRARDRLLISSPATYREAWGRRREIEATESPFTVRCRSLG